MPRYISAANEHQIETSCDMDPHRPGTRIMPGLARAHLTVYEPGEECSSTLPTVAEMLTKYVDPESGLVSLQGLVGLDLRLDPAALRELPPDLRVSPGYSFVTHEALARARERPPGQ